MEKLRNMQLAEDQNLMVNIKMGKKMEEVKNMILKVYVLMVNIKMEKELREKNIQVQIQFSMGNIEMEKDGMGMGKNLNFLMIQFQYHLKVNIKMENIGMEKESIIYLLIILKILLILNF